MNPVECYTGDIQNLALSGTNYESWDEVGKAFQRAASYRNFERVRRRIIGRRKGFRGSIIKKIDGRRKHRRPLWKRH
jgi:hypothetical protein